MADSVEDCTSWSHETIPNEDCLYVRVLDEHYDRASGEFHTLAFKNRTDGKGLSAMSSDWCKYGSPIKTQDSGRKKPANKHYHVISLKVAEIRDIIPKQRVLHDPVCNDPDPEVKDNQAHTNIAGPKSRSEFNGDLKESNRVKMAFANAIKEWEIRLP